MFERNVTAAPRRDRSVFCKVTSPKTSEIEEHFTFSKKHSGFARQEVDKGRGI